MTNVEKIQKLIEDETCGDRNPNFATLASTIVELLGTTNTPENFNSTARKAA